MDPGVSNAGDPAQALGALSAFLALGLGFVILTLLVALVVQAVFIGMAAGFVGLHGTFGTAFKAALIGWLFTIVFGVLAALAAPFLSPPGASAAQGIASVLAGTFAIKAAYETGFFRSLATYLISIVLTVIVVVVFVIVLVAALGISSAK